MLKVDLHLHSTASDGRLSPAELVRKAAAEELAIIALTDHDTVGGIAAALAAAQEFPTLRLIPGIEISTDIPEGEVHILGYFIDYTDRNLLTALEKMHNSRWERARRIIDKLGEMGYPIDWERVQEIAGEGTIGRPHIAQAMLESGYIDFFQEAFDKYIDRDGPAYIEREKVTPTGAVEMVVKAGGLPVLAHPLTLPEPEQLAINLKAVGLIGIEAYYTRYSTEDAQRLVTIANRYNLVATGGTDFHGINAGTEIPIGGVEIPEKSVEQLLALAQQSELKSASP
ncbi:MAG: PHP domain-containing protein [Promethearchaeota archaeon]